MNPEEMIQLALAGIQMFVGLISRIQAAHNMNDAQLEAYINQTDDQTRAMVKKYLAQLQPAPAAAPADNLPPTAPDAMTGAE